jgi:hypothetical protein
VVPDVWEITSVDYGTREHRVLMLKLTHLGPPLVSMLHHWADETGMTVIGVAAHKDSARPVGTCYYA